MAPKITVSFETSNLPHSAQYQEIIKNKLTGHDCAHKKTTVTFNNGGPVKTQMTFKLQRKKITSK